MKLVGDITYLRTGEGWLYLAMVIDLHSQMVVGWSMDDHMRTELIASALRMAHTHGHLATTTPNTAPNTAPSTSAGGTASNQTTTPTTPTAPVTPAAPVTVFHSDRGSQGGFKRSSQHLELVVLDDKKAASCRSCAASEDAVTGPVGFPAAG